MIAEEQEGRETCKCLSKPLSGLLRSQWPHKEAVWEGRDGDMTNGPLTVGPPVF